MTLCFAGDLAVPRTLIIWVCTLVVGAFTHGGEPVVADGQASRNEENAKVSIAPRGVIITLGSPRVDQGDLVGSYITADQAEEMLPVLAREVGAGGVVVLRVSSFGGLYSEVKPLVDVLHDRFKPVFRVAAWVDLALWDAAMVVDSVDEIYFTPHGVFGGAIHPPLSAWRRASNRTAERYQLADYCSVRGGYPLEILRTAIVCADLSWTPKASGPGDFFPDRTTGQYKLNDGAVFQLDAESAEAIGFSKGTASTPSELAHCLGYDTIDWVGVVSPDSPWPVCEAEAWNIARRKEVRRVETCVEACEEEFQRSMAYVRASSTVRDRDVDRENARRWLAAIRAEARNEPVVARIALRLETAEDFDEWMASRMTELDSTQN